MRTDIAAEIAQPVLELHACEVATGSTGGERYPAAATARLRSRARSGTVDPADWCRWCEWGSRRNVTNGARS
jgi:hypothetical protein